MRKRTRERFRRPARTNGPIDLELNAQELMRDLDPGWERWAKPVERSLPEKRKAA